MVQSFHEILYVKQNKHYVLVNIYMNSVATENDTMQKNVADTKPVLETKEQLIQKIREWVRVDNEMRAIQKEMALRKKEKKTISKELMEVMKLNNIDVFDLKDGQLVYASKQVKKPITKAGLLSILSVYFQGNEEKAMDLNGFIMDNREVVVKEQLVRKFNV
jgi:hypothetical protein